MPSAPYIPFAIDEVVIISGTPESSSAVGKAAPLIESVSVTGHATPSTYTVTARIFVFQYNAPALELTSVE